MSTVQNIVNNMKTLVLLDQLETNELRIAFMIKKLYGIEFTHTTVKEENVHLADPDINSCAYQGYYYFILESKGRNAFNRATPGGMWKRHGSICPIVIQGVNLASSSQLSWYQKGESRDTSTSYIMHEYKLEDNVLEGLLADQTLMDKVRKSRLCCIFSREAKARTNRLSVRNKKAGIDPSLIPLGYKFIPSDEVLIDYLIRKVKDETFTTPDIVDEPNHGFDPYDIFSTAAQSHGYYYCYLPSLYPDTPFVNRATRTGVWRIENAVPVMKNDKVVGYKSTWKWYEEDSPSRWIMHEYLLNPKLILAFPKKFQNEEMMEKMQKRVIWEIQRGASGSNSTHG